MIDPRVFWSSLLGSSIGVVGMLGVAGAYAWWWLGQ